MNIVFWILVILAACLLWVAATASLISARVGSVIKDTHDSIKDSLEVTERIRNE